MHVSVPGIYQNPAPYREQTLTYSTALAFTGRSAACAPPMATTAAAEPRTRLLIIFMLKPPSCSLFRRLRTPTGCFPFWAGSPKTAQSFRALQLPLVVRDLSELPHGTIRDPQPSSANMHVQI